MEKNWDLLAGGKIRGYVSTVLTVLSDRSIFPRAKLRRFQGLPDNAQRFAQGLKEGNGDKSEIDSKKKGKIPDPS